MLVFIPLGNLKKKIPLSKLEDDQFFRNLFTFLVDSEICLPFNKRNELNLKTNQKSNHEKSNLSVTFS